MTLEFKNIYILNETVLRKSLSSYFWPDEQKNLQREALVNLNKKEAWLCSFLEKGLRLDIKIIISKTDYANWSQVVRLQNANTVKSEFTFHDHIKYVFPEPILTIQHLAQDVEAVRKKIYVSNRFNEKAHQLWAAQYFMPASDRKYMLYMLGFNRTLLEEDEITLSKIKEDLLLLKNVRLLE